MDKILKDYCLSDKKNGLMLLDSPTGQGKTYAVLDFILRNYESIKGKIIFITSLKKNLPYNDLKKMFEDNGKLYDFEKNVLFIDSNVDSLIANFDEVKNAIPSQFKDPKIFYQLENNIATIRKYEDSIKTRGKVKDKEDQEDFEFEGSYHLYEKAKQDLYDTWEQKFRDTIKRELGKLHDNEGKALSTDKKIKHIEKDPLYSWIGKLYPAVFTKKRKIIFMSMDKFLARNATIVSPSYSFIDEKSITENSILFIDEVDAAKDTILTSIINNAISDKLGLLELFHDIYDGLHTTEFTKALTTPSQNTLKEIANGKKWSIPEELITALREESAKIRTEFDLQHLFKLHADEERTSFYLFQDYRFHNIFNGKKRANILVDKKNLVNKVVIRSEKSKEMATGQEENENLKQLNLYRLIARLNGFITYFQYRVKYIATNYLDNKNSDNKYFIENFTYESALRTVLAEFNINARATNWIVNHILSNKKKDNIYYNELATDFDFSVYEKGFRYYNFIDSENHDTQSKISMLSAVNTPEKILIKFAEKSKVVGISATATLPTVTGNFDTDYIKDKLGSDYYSVPKADIQRLREKIKQNYADIDKVNITTKSVSVTEYNIRERLVEIFGNEDFSNLCYAEMEKLVYGDDNYRKHCYNRYVRILWTMKEFIVNSNIKSLLCMMTKLATSDGNFKFDFLRDQFNVLKQIYGNSGHRIWFRKLDGRGIIFERNKERLKAELQKGTKIFVLSTYQTLGAGQNLQYSIPDEDKDSIVQINENIFGEDEKDFDAIYLDNPTNVVVSMGDESSEADLYRFIFQALFLKKIGQLSEFDADTKIKQAISKFNGISANFTPYISSSIPSVAFHYARVIIQAIGRICRTKNKNRDICIYYDEKIREFLGLAKSDLEKRLLNTEFLELLKDCESGVEQDTAQFAINKSNLEANIISQAYETSFYAKQLIDDMVNYKWTDFSKKNWEDLRQIVLQHPYFVGEKSGKMPHIYIKLPQKQIGYAYKVQEDYNKIELAFSDWDDKYLFVGPKSCALPKLMEIPDIKEYFISQGYETEFKEAEHMLAPVIFNNIYKGALGEVIGKHIFENVVVHNKKLCTIDDLDKFELFDFSLGNIYLDFKLWNDNTLFNNTLEIQKVQSKLGKCGGRLAMIVNVLYENERGRQLKCGQIPNTNIVVIPYLWDSERHEFNQDAIAYIRNIIYG